MVAAESLAKSSTARLSRVRNEHGYTDHSAHDLRFPRRGKTAYLAFGIRMGNCQQITLAHLAPTANIFASEFEKVDRPHVLVPPFDGQDLSLILINLDNRMRSDDRIHRPIRTGFSNRRTFKLSTTGNWALPYLIPLQSRDGRLLGNVANSPLMHPGEFWPILSLRFQQSVANAPQEYRA